LYSGSVEVLALLVAGALLALILILHWRHVLWTAVYVLLGVGCGWPSFSPGCMPPSPGSP
jgi:hypothetical protein